jgi:hypothetical protein
MKCPSCGADNAPAAANCNYCGSHLPLTGSLANSAVFARIKSSTAFAARNSPERHARLPNVGSLQKVFLFVFFAIFVGGAAVMSIFMCGMGGLFAGGGGAMALMPVIMAVVPLGMAAFGVFMFLAIRKRMSSIENDPVQPTAVIVVDKRTHVSGGSGDSSASTHYFVTCELEDGSRQEYQVWDGSLYGRMAANDGGILFLRGGYGLDFDRVT